MDYNSSPLEIGFNARYLIDIAAQLDSDTALFKLNTRARRPLSRTATGQAHFMC